MKFLKFFLLAKKTLGFSLATRAKPAVRPFYDEFQTFRHFCTSACGDVVNRRIFCNVELNNGVIEAVGFDMDYTLAQYKHEFDLLAFEGAKKKLISVMGYPKEIMEFKYNPHSFRRGVIIDKAKGNFLKVDRHKYVRKVYHGIEEMNDEKRKSTYGSDVYSYTENYFVNIDTLFHVVNALLFANLVDFNDRFPHVLNKSYEAIYQDIRYCVDLCHTDGAIKNTVMKDPSKYILQDEGIVPMMQRFREAGKKVFLLTNSLWDYTNVVMNYLVCGSGKHAGMDWTDLFNLVVVGACKPAFFQDENLSLFKIDKSTGSLQNVEDNSILAKVDCPRIVQGGRWRDLHKMLSVQKGDRILYVGDHMYADVLRTKRTLGWRTCLIIPELERELAVASAEAELGRRVFDTRRLQHELDEYLDILQERLRRWPVDTHGEPVDAASKSKLTSKLAVAKAYAAQVSAASKQLIQQYNARFNNGWGLLFKAGFQDSRFAKQVNNYACIYTSRASNLGLVSPQRTFRPIQDLMPHEWSHQQVTIDLDKAFEDLPLATADSPSGSLSGGLSSTLPR